MASTSFSDLCYYYNHYQTLYGEGKTERRVATEIRKTRHQAPCTEFSSRILIFVIVPLTFWLVQRPYKVMQRGHHDISIEIWPTRRILAEHHASKPLQRIIQHSGNIMLQKSTAGCLGCNYKVARSWWQTSAKSFKISKEQTFRLVLMMPLRPLKHQ